MRVTSIREKVIEEVKLVPEYRLQDVYDFIHYFRLGLESEPQQIDDIMEFAGSWDDMPEELYTEFLAEVDQRRQLAFSRRRQGETGPG